MTKMQSSPILAFVWRPDEISPAVVDTARRTATVALFDISTHRTENLTKPLKDAGAKEVKISAEQFMEPALERFLQDSGVSTLWVEFHPAFAPCKAEAFLERVRDLSARFTIVPISGDPDFLGLALQSKW
ncbi:MAG: Acyl transferase, partial [Deltaproteobacteria bacterium]|nr:Acyl transferase [Deltaproteobacteria bacterium]